MGRARFVAVFTAVLVLLPMLPALGADYPGSPVRKGSTGDAVRAVQEVVGVPADGVYGPQTQTAVAAWQTSEGLLPIGSVGPATWAEMFGAESETTVGFEGAGWGHGVGLSQHGAQGMALEGRSATEILTYFYTGTTVRAITDLVSEDSFINRVGRIWLGVQQDRTVFEFTPRGGPVALCHGGDGEGVCPKSVVPQANETWQFVSTGSNTCEFRLDGVIQGPAGNCRASISWDDGVHVDTRIDRYPSGTSPIDIANGTIKVRPTPDDPSQFHVSLDIELETYLRGIAEMPSAWEPAALESQAIAARSFAVSKALERELESGRTASQDPTFKASWADNCMCHIRGSTADQYYNGLFQEGQVPWTQAVVATADEVLAHQSVIGKPISTNYSSSTGGRTENSEDRFSAVVPYLRSVPDPWSLDPAINFFAIWQYQVSAASIASQYGFGALQTVEAATRHESGSVASVVLTGRDSSGEPRTVTITGAQAVASFGLRGRFFNVDWDGGRRFVDTADSVHVETIEQLADLGITRGCNPPENDRYCPGDDVTRQQMAAFLVRALNLPATDDDFFSDDDGSMFENDINRLAASGITRGCTDDSFCGEAPITRQQMAAFITRALELPGADLDPYIDDDGSMFENDINRLAASGITRGCNPPTNDRFCPTDNVTRAQMASFLIRALAWLDADQ